MKGVQSGRLVQESKLRRLSKIKVSIKERWREKYLQAEKSGLVRTDIAHPLHVITTREEEEEAEEEGASSHNDIEEEEEEVEGSDGLFITAD